MNLRVLLLSVLLFAPTLGACTEPPPTLVTVPGHAAVLDGPYTGEVRLTPDAPPVPLTVKAQATYRDRDTYTVTGTLTFRDTTYTLRGQ